MKKLLLFALMPFLVSTLLSAQTSVGVQAGVVLSNVEWSYKNPYIDYALANETKTAFSFSANIEFLRKKNFSLVADVAYTQKGFQTKIENTTETQPEGNGTFYIKKYNFDFLTIAPLAKFRLPVKSFAPFVFAGPRMDIFLTDQRSNWFLMNSQYRNDIVFGVTYGLGLEYDFETFRLQFRAASQTDFMPFYDAPYDGSNVGLSLKNRAIIFDFGVSFNLN